MSGNTSNKLGINKIVHSAKMTFALICLAALVLCTLTGHVGGAAFASAMSVIAGIFGVAHTITDLRSMAQNAWTDAAQTETPPSSLPPKGQV